jgi:hypothetical protein
LPNVQFFHIGQWWQVLGVDLALWAALMSIRTGLPGVGLLCANWVGGNVGADLDMVISPGHKLECVVGAGPDWYKAWKASLAAWFWSSWTAISNHPSESVSEGLPVAIAPIAEAMQQSNPQVATLHCTYYNIQGT